MSKRLGIPDMVLERMYSMYGQGFNFTQIAIETGYSGTTVAHRIRAEGVKITEKLNPPVKINKYDHLFEEKTCEGKMYNQYYVKKN